MQGQARKLGFFESVAGGIDYEDDYNRQVRSATPEQVRDTVRRYLTVENASITLLLPNEMAGQVAALEAGLGARLGKSLAAAEKRWGTPAEKAVADGEVVRVQLPSGARLLVKRDSSVSLVAMRAVWMGGLRYEDEKSNGVNNMLASLVTRGTTTRTAEEIVREVEGMAGAIGGFSGRNSFGVRAELVARHWERGLEILADCILNPAFGDEELEKERRQVLEEIRAQQDNVSAEAFRLFSTTLFKKHPYRYDVIGTPESVAGLTRRRLLD